jgi:hypothetical protein
VEVNQRFPPSSPNCARSSSRTEIFNISAPVTLIHTRTVDPRYGAKVTGKVGKTTVGFRWPTARPRKGQADDASADPRRTAGRVR